MSTPILATKLYIPPPRPKVVPRPRLIERLNKGLHGKLTLISAPAGFGKTTLVSEWVAALTPSPLPAGEGPEVRVAWLSLDAGENDPARFLAYFVAALQTISSGIGAGAIFCENAEVMAALDSPQPPPIEPLLTILLNQIAAIPADPSPPLKACPERSEGTGFILVLDDYHTIDSKPVAEILAFLVERQPPQMHLVIATREDPQLPLARLRVRDQLTELRAADLRFTPAEAADFLNEVMGLSLSAENIAALEARTEGWIAGLQLAALSMQGHQDVTRFIQSFTGSHRYVLDYLAEEVIRQQGEALRSFLIQTSILERFNADVCCALTGRGDAQAAIAQLEQANLFIVPLDDERSWYRYHHLFADYLRTLLTRPEQSRLYQQASAWHEANDLMGEAVQYALAGGDTNFAADVIERALQRDATWSAGNLTQWLSWLDALPPPAFQSRPQLNLDASRILYLAGRFELAESHLMQAEQALEAAPALPDAERGQVQALAALYRGAIAAMRGDAPQAIAQIAFAQSRIPRKNHLAHARAFFSLGLAYEIADQNGQAVANYSHASAEAKVAGVLFLAIHALCAAAQVQIRQGRLHQAEQTCRAAIQLAAGARLPPLGLAYTILGGIALERNDLAAAEKLLADGMALARQGGLMEDVILGLASLARLRGCQGDTRGALAAMQEVKSIVQAYGIQHMDVHVAAYLARLQLLLRQIPAAAQWAAEVRPLRADAPYEFVDLTLARVLLATRDLEAIPAILRPLLERATAAGRTQACIETLMLLGLCQHARGDTPAALELLGQSLRLAASEGYARIFLDEGQALLDLLPKARHHAPELVDSLLGMGTAAGGARPAPCGQLPEPLSEQELRVLRLLAAGKSNQQIADELVISLGTAKWHVHNVLQKLGVSSRSQAIAQARDLGLH
ncbi:MAG: LuxR C-terminal-related transcriptional regulator [Anaerolineae bacterium]